MRLFTLTCCVLVAFSGLQLVAQCPGGTEYSGTCFPEGNHSFADTVIRYAPDHLFSSSNTQPDPAFQDASMALGQPDNVGSDGYVSLGFGGLIELAFSDNILSNSGTSETDLRVYEVGSGTGSGTGEWVQVALRPADAATLAVVMMTASPTEAGFYFISNTSTSTELDIDAFFPGYAAGDLRFDAVQLIDVTSQGGGLGGATVGADIDAVGAMTTITTTYRGTHEDFVISSAVNLDPYSADLGSEIKSGTGGPDMYRLRFESPEGGLNFVPYAVIAQVFPTGAFTGSLNPNVHVNPMESGLFVVVDSNGFQPFPGLLPASGIEMAFNLPAFGAGLSVLFQGFVLTNLAENNIYATSDAHVIDIL